MRSTSVLPFGNSRQTAFNHWREFHWSSRHPRTKFGVVGGAICLSFLATPAYAYIDPGTGGMLLQLLLGGVAGGLVIVKLYWQRIRSVYQRVFGGRGDDGQTADRG